MARLGCLPLPSPGLRPRSSPARPAPHRGGSGEPEGVRGTSGTRGSAPRTLQLEIGCARGERAITSCRLAWEGFQQLLLMALLLGSIGKFAHSNKGCCTSGFAGPLGVGKMKLPTCGTACAGRRRAVQAETGGMGFTWLLGTQEEESLVAHSEALM